MAAQSGSVRQIPFITRNKECIEAFDMMTSEKISNYLNGKGFKQIHKDNEMEIWEKGDTRVIFDGYDDNQYGYMTTEYLG